MSPSKQMYHCFGCGVSGNVITFVMEYENYSFREAVEMLADRSGVKLPKMEYSKEAKAKADRKAALLEINKLAANYFYYQLKQPRGKIGYDYLVKRKLTDETIRRFGLGFSNKISDDLYRYLKSKGYEDELLKDTGLVTIEERGARDKFWNRVMFPIMDVNSRVIGFGGRVLGDGEPKYLNSPETMLFDKSRNLYGLNYARTSRKKYMMLCEGYMDVISMHQAGYTNAVASLGTALTEQHAALLKRYTDQVILTYDSDGAGVKAALRAIPILKRAGISTKVLNMRPYKDPDEFMKNLGAEEFEKRIETARNSFLYEDRCAGKPALIWKIRSRRRHFTIRRRASCLNLARRWSGIIIYRRFRGNTLSIMKICGGWSTSSEAGMASGRRQQADMQVAMVIHIEPEIRLVRYKTGR